ncbi:MAG: LysE family translocator [Rhodobacter sp.]|nr:LysE family translocator [Rhodobacter sp.]
MVSFVAACFLLISTPGPGVLSTAGFGAAYGFRAGLRYVIGLCLGQLVVIFLVVSGLAALLFAVPVMRTVLLALSTGYLLYLAARIAFAGSRIGFIEAQRPPGILAGLLLQPINPKAYVVNTTLFSGFVLWPDAYWSEVAFKLVVLNVIWVPIHLAWLYAGVALERLNLPTRTQRAINFAMAAAMLAVVALALYSTLRTA